MPTLSIRTLGCKLNQLESEAIALAFKKEGCVLEAEVSEGIASKGIAPEGIAPKGVVAPKGADIIIINTCTVTSRAEQKARRLIRKALREHPGALVIVTGCYAQLDPEKIASLEEEEDRGGSLPPGSSLLPPAFPPPEGRRTVRGLTPPPSLKGDPSKEGDPSLKGDPSRQGDHSLAQNPGPRRLLVVPGGRKAALLELPRLLGTGPFPPEIPGAADPFAFDQGGGLFRSRRYLKIQDGCDHRCAYCRVGLARGRSRSLEAETVLERLRLLEAGGAGEAVLTGVNIALYRDGGRDLGGLLVYLLGNTSRIGIRLSSLEPGGFSEQFFGALADPRIRPHFHLSLQSGSAAVLGRMGRDYAPADVRALVGRLREAKGDPFLGCDMITGFPGETHGDFEATRMLCEESGFAGIHAFPFSRRPGTPAWSMGPRVPDPLAAERVEALNALARRGREAYTARWLGRTVAFVPEKGGPRGYAAGVTENYLKVLVPEGRAAGGGAPPAARCRLLPLPAGLPGDALGEPEHPPAN